jgi:ADP-heptose:LPS heptosyltransferase
MLSGRNHIFMTNRWATDWDRCKRLLIVRLDNLGDVLMSEPAIRAIKNHLRCHITLLTSRVAVPAAELLPEIDNVIVFDAPWMKFSDVDSNLFCEMATTLRQRRFDGSVVFTTFSQSPFPALLLCYLADIPLRLAYARENPYHLLTHWVPDKEPYRELRHQVRRDLDLVSAIGAGHSDEQLKLQFKSSEAELNKRMRALGVPDSRYMLVHPGVSDPKREYALERWKTICQLLPKWGIDFIVISGSTREHALCEAIRLASPAHCINLAGQTTFEELAWCIKKAETLISVNTAAMHIGAAFQTPMIVLYAMTNPQHSPWMSQGYLFPMAVKASLKSRNEVLSFLDAISEQEYDVPPADEIAKAALKLWNGERAEPFPLIVGSYQETINI